MIDKHIVVSVWVLIIFIILVEILRIFLQDPYELIFPLGCSQHRISCLLKLVTL
jgi:hypothetical protein